MSSIVKIYDYADEDGNLLYQNYRFEPKDFSPRRPDGNGDYIWDLKGVKRTLYRLPETVKIAGVIGLPQQKRIWKQKGIHNAN